MRRPYVRAGAMRMTDPRVFLPERLTRAMGVIDTVREVDPLADVLDLSRVRGALLASVRAAAPWGIDLPPGMGAALHAVTAGTAWLRVDEQAPLQLMPGDLLLLPGGIGYRLASAPDARCRPFDRALKEELMTPAGDLTLPGPGAVTTFVCAGYDYDLDVAPQLMRLLPDVIHIPTDAVAGREISALVGLLAAEVGTRSPGSRAAAARLIDLLLINAIRRWNESRGDDAPASWLTALRDPTIAGVLALLHERPGEPWTLAALGSEVHISRATLARRFTEAVGEPPLTYLARWRMHLASHRLKHSADTIESIARSVGYSSEYAFNRAFARHRGQPPGRYRRQALAAPAS